MLGAAGVIGKGEWAWDSGLTGSPCGRHDGTQYIVGYEGYKSLEKAESFGVAVGTSPTSLTKLAGNPIVHPYDHRPPLLESVVMDAMWVADGLAFISCHSGVMSETGVVGMWRMVSEKTDPTTWVRGDFELIEQGLITPNVRNDLTTSPDGRYVTAPANDASLVLVPGVPA